MRARWRRLLWAAGAVLLGIPVLGFVAFRLWLPTPPAEGPRIGVSMTTSLVGLVRRPAYEAAIARAGGRPVSITPPASPEAFEPAIDAVLDGIDALVLGGGGDVDPALYGGDPESAADVDRHRDEFEIRLIRGALERGMPILGLCRGIQILNVAHGGTVRDLRADEALSEQHGIDLVDSWTAHDVSVAADTQLAAVVGAGLRRVNSWHGQAVGRVGDGLLVCATADDGVIEALERPDRPFVMGIQWHPEFTVTDEGARALFRELVAQADTYRATAGPDPG